MKTSNTVEKIMPSFVKALAELKAITKDATNPFLKNKYVSLDMIIENAKPVLAANQLSFIQTISTAGVETFILHDSGEWISSGVLLITPQESKGLSFAQSMGVATTYAKRYQLGSILGLSTEDDGDGNHGDNKGLAPVNGETKSAVVPKGRIVFDDDIKNEIQLLNSVDELKKYHQQLKELKDDVGFLEALSKRRKELEGKK